MRAPRRPPLCSRIDFEEQELDDDQVARHPTERAWSAAAETHSLGVRGRVLAAKRWLLSLALGGVTGSRRDRLPWRCGSPSSAGSAALQTHSEKVGRCAGVRRDFLRVRPSHAVSIRTSRWRSGNAASARAQRRRALVLDWSERRSRAAVLHRLDARRARRANAFGQRPSRARSGATPNSHSRAAHRRNGLELLPGK